ncbi:putative ribonuclease H-like domain-containing protein [Tanacetum coccineum]
MAEQEQERLDHESVMKIQEELDAAERQRMDQVHQAAQGFTDDEWDDILARVAADKDFKFFAQQRAEVKRNKPMTPAQQKEYMSTYIKNQEGGNTLKQLKELSFEEVKEIFEATMRKVQSFVPMDSETGEASGSVQEKTCEEPKAKELSQEQLHQMMMVIPVEEVYIEALQVSMRCGCKNQAVLPGTRLCSIGGHREWPRKLATHALPNGTSTYFQLNTVDAKTMSVVSKMIWSSKRFLPPAGGYYVVVWMNKVDIEIMSIDDLYNNFKIVEQDVKKSVGASSGAQILAFMTTPSTSSTNNVNTANPAYEVSTVSPNINTACPQVSTTNVSDNTMYAFMVENPNGSNLLHQDLEQIHEDDLEAIDSKWHLSLLSIWAKRYFQRTSMKILINANDTAGYDKSKVECFNFHKMGHFSRECRAPRNKEGQFRYQDNTRKQGNNEDTFSKAMLAIDGVGFDWSDMAEEQVQRNMALMAFSDFELNQIEFTIATYKRGLATIEEQLVTYRKNEVLFSEEVAVLKREVACKRL